MGYNNYYKLRVLGEIKKQVKVSDDGLFKTQDPNINFCPKTGSPLKVIEKIDPDPISTVMSELYLISDNAKFLLKIDGDSKNPGSGYDLEELLCEISKNHPNLLFLLYCTWDTPLSQGKVATDIYFIEKGQSKMAETKVHYINPFDGKIHEAETLFNLNNS